MAPVPVELQLQPHPAVQLDIEVVEDLDELVESSKCSCNAGDDNPY